MGVQNSSVVTIVDNDLPVISYSSATYSVTEGNAATITVNMSIPSASPVSVKYSTTNGTATAGPDYTANVSTLLFLPGETSKTFTVLANNDTLYEASETVN